MKIEEAISDADKESQDYKYYDIQRVRLITSKKKPIKDSPFLNSYSDNQLCSLCKAIMNRRRNRYVSLDMSVSVSPDSKKRAISVQSVDMCDLYSRRQPFLLKTR